jgi:hypothetical protein
MTKHKQTAELNNSDTLIWNCNKHAAVLDNLFQTALHMNKWWDIT